MPRPGRCYAWGRALGDILRARPERLGWDRDMLEVLKQGRGEELARVTAAEFDKTGNIELRTWITILGAVGRARADVYCYEPSWHHGNCVLEWPL